MGCNYHAEIINLSQQDDSIMKQFSILEVRKRFLGLIKIFTVIIPENKMKEAVNKFQSNMSTKLKKEWYVTFYNAENVIIVFRKRIFELSVKGINPVYQQLLVTNDVVDKEKWDEMITYAKSLRIPDNQCDFLPPDFHKKCY